VLIDWDWGASGVWFIGSPDALRAPTPCFADLLSAALLSDLKEWNDAGGEIYGPRSTPSRVAETAPAFWARAHKLAKQVQGQLGPDWEVLYNSTHSSGGWAWTWVRQPSSW
jgi:hypothetical protein